MAGQRTEVGCHWSRSESGEDAEERGIKEGHSEAEEGNGWETLGVQSDTEGTGSHRENGQAEEAGDKRKVGSDGRSEETMEKEGRTGQGSVWQAWWQRIRKKKTGAEAGDGDQDTDQNIGENEVKGARMWGGDGFKDGKAVEKGKIRAWFGNIRRFKVDDSNVAHINEIENRMWKQTNAYGVAVTGLADTGLSVGSGKQDHLCLLHKAGQLGAKARMHRAGDGMGWSVSKAGEGRGEEKGMLVGGTAIAVHEKWNYRADDVVSDKRGWGRYTLRLMRGAAGKDAIFGTVYGPQSGSDHWKVQEREMSALRNVGERGIGDDPRHQFYLDLFQELFEHFGRGVAMVIGGDFNARWGKQYRGGKVLKPLESFAEALRLGNAMEVRHGSLLPTRFELWKGKMRSSTPDHILVSEGVMKSDTDMRIGVLQGEELNDSDHMQLLVELDCQVLLGLDEERCKEPAPLPKWVQPKLYLSDDKMVLDYAKEVNRLGEERGCEAEIEHLEQMAVKWSGHDPDAEESPVLQAQMDAVIRAALECCWRQREWWRGSRRCKERHSGPKGRNCGLKRRSQSIGG